MFEERASMIGSGMPTARVAAWSGNRLVAVDGVSGGPGSRVER
jgi:hypothetical protein